MSTSPPDLDGAQSFEDLDQKTKAVCVALAADGDWSYGDIAEHVGVPESYPEDVADEYADIITDLEARDELPDVTLSDDDSESNAGDSSDTAAETADGASTDATDESQDDQSMSSQYGKRRDEKTYEDLSETQKRVIDEVAKDPDRTDEEIGDAAGCTGKWANTIRNEFSHLIEERRTDAATAGDESTRIDDETDTEPETQSSMTESSDTTESVLIAGVPADLSAEIARDWEDDRTPKQKKIIVELLKEPDPFDPDRTYSAIGEAVDSHGTYVTTVQEDHEALIESLYEALDDPLPGDAAVGDDRRDDVVAEPEETLPTEGEDSTQASLTEDSTEERAAVDATARAAIAEGDGVESALRDLRGRVESIQRMAENELQYAPDGEVTMAHGRKVVADEVLGLIDDRLESTGESASSSGVESEVESESP